MEEGRKEDLRGQREGLSPTLLAVKMQEEGHEPGEAGSLWELPRAKRVSLTCGARGGFLTSHDEDLREPLVRCQGSLHGK